MGATAPDEPSIEAIETAHRTGDIAALASLAERANKRIARSSGDEQIRVRYALALIAWRSNHLWESEPDGEQASTEQLELARQQLRTILESNPEHVEALALRSAVLGELSETSVLSRIKLGAAALRSLDRAEEIAPNNPRVALQVSSDTISSALRRHVLFRTSAWVDLVLALSGSPPRPRESPASRGCRAVVGY